VELPTSVPGTVEPAGSGLRLKIPGSDPQLTNFVIDTGGGFVSGDVPAGAVDVAEALIFQLVPCDSGALGACATLPNGAVVPMGLGLRISNELGGAPVGPAMVRRRPSV